MIHTWRSLRAQVLLWTVLPLTILLIAVSLTGVTTHQNSMRNLAREDNAQLATAVASALAQQVEREALGGAGADPGELGELADQALDRCCIHIRKCPLIRTRHAPTL